MFLHLGQKLPIFGAKLLGLTVPALNLRRDSLAQILKLHSAVLSLKKVVIAMAPNTLANENALGEPL